MLSNLFEKLPITIVWTTTEVRNPALSGKCGVAEEVLEGVSRKG